MQFKENQTIYLQIAERISDEILLGHYAIGSRIPSVREYAALVEVNANTVMRSYEFLQTQSIIFNKRGIGFFVSPEELRLILLRLAFAILNFMFGFLFSIIRFTSSS